MGNMLMITQKWGFVKTVNYIVVIDIGWESIGLGMLGLVFIKIVSSYI
jgi:hypothetical protein